MGVSFSRALSAVFLGSVVLGFSYAVSRYGLSPWKDNPYHPLTSLGNAIQRNMYPLELRADDFARAAAQRVVKDPALMPKVATPCDTTWRPPAGRFGYGSKTYRGKSPVDIKPMQGQKLDKAIVTRGNAFSTDRDRVTAVEKVSPEIYPPAIRISMMEYIKRRVFGDKAINFMGTNYNTALFTHGSPYQRTRYTFDGYYAIMVNGQKIPFLPPAVQPLPTKHGNGQRQADGYAYAGSNKDTKTLVDFVTSKNAWHWVNLEQWPTFYYRRGSVGVIRRTDDEYDPYKDPHEYIPKAYNLFEKDLERYQFLAYDIVYRDKPQEAATLEWYPVEPRQDDSKEAGFVAVQFATDNHQYLPLEQWSDNQLRTYILTYLNWNPEQLIWVSLASAKTRNAEQKRVLQYGV